jgi:hypothetical protein
LLLDNLRPEQRDDPLLLLHRVISATASAAANATTAA